MPRIDTLFLRVRDPEAQTAFYRDVLGMRDRGGGRVGYADAEAGIRFLPAAAAYAPTPDDLYWKIALSTPNIERACDQLAAACVDVSPPRQFGDVGYLAHFRDPEGFTIELIDHWFQGNRPDAPIDATRFGGGAHLSLITLRTADMRWVDDVVTAWGMTPLSIQRVADHAFTLRFYAFTDDQPPQADLHAVENREWLYQRPYTVLEIQHRDAQGPTRVIPPPGAGYAGFSIADAAPPIVEPKLQVI